MSDHYSYKIEELQEELRALDAGIERLKADRDKWEYECKIAYKAFNESNVKRMYEDMHQTDIEEHNRMLHEIAVLKALLTRAADALEEACMDRGIIGAPLIDELRKAAE